MNKMVNFFWIEITQFLLAHGDVGLTNAMLKDYNVGNAYVYFFFSWGLLEAYILKTKSECMDPKKITVKYIIVHVLQGKKFIHVF